MYLWKSMFRRRLWLLQGILLHNFLVSDDSFFKNALFSIKTTRIGNTTKKNATSVTRSEPNGEMLNCLHPKFDIFWAIRLLVRVWTHIPTSVKLMQGCSKRIFGLKFRYCIVYESKRIYYINKIRQMQQHILNV